MTDDDHDDPPYAEHQLTISADDLTVKYSGCGTHELEVGLTVTNLPTLRRLRDQLLQLDLGDGPHDERDHGLTYVVCTDCRARIYLPERKP